MQKLTLIILLPLITIFTATIAFAQSEYTLEEVATHNSIQDCWMIFEDTVYAFPESYINNHDNKYMQIDSWCGKDMTQDFKTKAGSGEDHKSFSYAKLEEYVVGTFAKEDSNTNSNDTQSDNQPTKKNNNPYNFWLPALLGYGSYTLYWAFTKTPSLKKYRVFNKNTFNLTFNTIMLLCLLFPIAGFGYFMIASYSYDSLRDVDFDFLYWHVEFGIFFAGLMLGHFLTRFKLYKAPLRLFFKRRPTTVIQAVTKQ